MRSSSRVNHGRVRLQKELVKRDFLRHPPVLLGKGHHAALERVVEPQSPQQAEIALDPVGFRCGHGHVAVVEQMVPLLHVAGRETVGDGIEVAGLSTGTAIAVAGMD